MFKKFIGLNTYFIYCIQSGSAKYIGSTNNYTRRMQQHRKELEENTHVNNILQAEYNKTGEFSTLILVQSETVFRKKVLKVEQRHIRKHSNCNEGTAAKEFYYDLSELGMDIVDIFWRIIFA